MRRKYFFIFAYLLASLSAWPADGDKFTATNGEGIEMTFQVISEAEKTCQAGYYRDRENGYSEYIPSVLQTTEGSVIIPSVANGYTVVAINKNGFSGTKITSLTIPESVTTIGEYAFQGCSSMISITIPESVKTIKYHAFSNCSSLPSINLPNSLETIEEGAFSECTQLSQINIPDGVKNIGGYILSGCPNVTVNIGNCDRKKYFYPVFRSYAGAGETSIKIIIKDGVTTIGGSCFTGNDRITAVSIPNSVTTIEGSDWYYFTEGAFSGCSRLASVTIPNSVTTIGKSAFAGCAITTLEIPGSANTIEDYAFSDCPNLETVIIGEGVQTIFRTFQRCTKLKSVSFPSSVTLIGTIDGAYSAFEGCRNLETISIAAGNSVYDSRDNSNAIIRTATNTLELGCKTTIIPQSVSTIGTKSFYSAELNSINIPSGVTKLAYRAFNGNLETISVESSNPVYDSRDNCNAVVETTTNTIVLGCKNTVIPSSVTTIGECAFAGCTALTSITIPSGVESINSAAFSECFNLASINIPSSITHIGASILEFTAWIDNQPDGIMYIGNWAYGVKGDDANITSLVIKEGTVGIADGAFSGGWQLYYLQSISFPNSLKYIGDSSFKDCARLKTTILPEQLVSIGKYAFYNCTELTTVSIPESCTSIDDRAFSDCGKLEVVKSFVKEPFEIKETVFTVVNYNDWSEKFSSATLYVPSGTKEKYMVTEGWKQFNSIVEMTDESAVTITAQSYTITYGDDLPSFEFTCEESTLSGTPNIACEATATSPVGTYPIVITQGSVVNENVSYVNGTLTIGKAPLKITAKNYVIKQGDALPTFEADYEGFKNNETEAVLTTKPTLTTTATSASEPGTYDIIVSGAEATNYEITYVKGTLTIEQLEIKPVDKTTEISIGAELTETADLENNVIDDVYYNVGPDGYDTTDGSVVIVQTTNMNQITDATPGSADVKNNFTGLILKVAKGKGSIKVNVKTEGTAQLAVQVGNGTPVMVSKTERGDVVADYDVEEDTYVYIYAVIGSSSAPARRASSTDMVKIYGITVSPGVTAISIITNAPSAVGNYYTLDGQKLEGLPTKKGVYIVNGRKVVVK